MFCYSLHQYFFVCSEKNIWQKSGVIIFVTSSLSSRYDFYESERLRIYVYISGIAKKMLESESKIDYNALKYKFFENFVLLFISKMFNDHIRPTSVY